VIACAQRLTVGHEKTTLCKQGLTNVPEQISENRMLLTQLFACLTSLCLAADP
jgi:hypothetical protein